MRNPTGRYILIGQTAVPCDHLMEWARWMEEADRRVHVTMVGDWEVSTIFMGIDHNWTRMITGKGKPLLYETMVFYRPPSGHTKRQMTFDERMEWERALESTLSEHDLALIYHQERWHDWSEAEAGHEQVVTIVELHTGLTRTVSSTALPDPAVPIVPGDPE